MTPLQPREPTVKRLMRLGISVLLLAAVYSVIDWRSLLAALSGFSPAAALALLAIYAGSQFISAIKWRIFLRAVGIEPGWQPTVRAYFFGLFVNSYGLGTVGGDMARSVALKARKGDRTAVLATVVADRLHGLMVLVTIGAVALWFVHPDALGRLAGPAALLAVVLVSAGWWVGPRLATRIFPTHHRLGAAAARAARAFPRRGAPLVRATVISCAFHGLQILMVYVMTRELGAAVPLAFLFAVVPIVNVAASLPISVSGLGVREALYVFFFVPQGYPAEVAVALGAIWVVMVTIVGMLGGAASTRGLAFDRSALQ